MHTVVTLIFLTIATNSYPITNQAQIFKIMVHCRAECSCIMVETCRAYHYMCNQTATFQINWLFSYLILNDKTIIAMIIIH